MSTSAAPNAFSCPAQVRGRVEHVGSRGALDIEVLGEVTAAALTHPVEPAEPPLRNEAGLFDLTLVKIFPVVVVVWDFETGEPKRDESGGLKRETPFKRKRLKKDGDFDPDATEFGGDADFVPSTNAINLIANLEKAKTSPLWRILVALSIRHVGAGRGAGPSRTISARSTPSVRRPGRAGRGRGRRRHHRRGAHRLVRGGLAPRHHPALGGRRGAVLPRQGTRGPARPRLGRAARGAHGRRDGQPRGVLPRGRDRGHHRGRRQGPRRA